MGEGLLHSDFTHIISYARYNYDLPCLVKLTTTTTTTTTATTTATTATNISSGKTGI